MRRKRRADCVRDVRDVAGRLLSSGGQEALSQDDQTQIVYKMSPA